jgi:hypothetical protein
MGADIPKQCRLLAEGDEQDSMAARVQAGLPGGGEGSRCRKIFDVDKLLTLQQAIVGCARLRTIGSA